MHRQSKHFSSDWCEITVRRVLLGGNSAQNPKQLLGAFDRLDIWIVEPVKIRCFANSEGMQKQNHFGEVSALDFRCIPFSAIQVIAFGPEPVASARSSSSGTSLALICRCPA